MSPPILLPPNNLSVEAGAQAQASRKSEKHFSMAHPKDFDELFEALSNMQRGGANQKLGDLNRVGNANACAALKATVNRLMRLWH